jgi:hypothetical protein
MYAVVGRLMNAKNVQSAHQPARWLSCWKIPPPPEAEAGSNAADDDGCESPEIESLSLVRRYRTVYFSFLPDTLQGRKRPRMRP